MDAKQMLEWLIQMLFWVSTILLIVGIVARFLRQQMKSFSVDKLPLGEREKKIWETVQNAVEIADWLYSHVNGAGGDKLKAALDYAKRQLKEYGIQVDMRLLEYLIEKCVGEKKHPLVRYGDVPRQEKGSVAADTVK